MENGYVKLPDGLTEKQVQEVRDYFDRFDCLDGYIPGQAKKPAQPKAEHKDTFCCYETRVTLEAPHLLDFALSEPVLKRVTEYIPDPVIYSMNTYWTFAIGKAGTQYFHRDYDDDKFLSLFFYLTDANPGDGGQYYVRGSHKPEFKFNFSGKAATRILAEQYSDLVDAITGPAGTCVLMNPYGLHAGGKPLVERLICWVRFGTGPNKAYAVDRLKPIECNVAKRPMLRLLVA